METQSSGDAVVDPERPDAPAELEPENDETPGDAGVSDDGRGGFRTCDLSRVKRDEGEMDQPPEQGRLF
jgi:hypothetical protein